MSPQRPFSAFLPQHTIPAKKSVTQPFRPVSSIRQRNTGSNLSCISYECFSRSCTVVQHSENERGVINSLVYEHYPLFFCFSPSYWEPSICSALPARVTTTANLRSSTHLNLGACTLPSYSLNSLTLYSTGYLYLSRKEIPAPELKSAHTLLNHPTYIYSPSSPLPDPFLTVGKMH